MWHFRFNGFGLKQSDMKPRVHFLPEGLTKDRPVLAGRWGLMKPHPLLHYHDSLEILYAERRFVLSVGREFLLQAGTMFILPAGVQHIARPIDGESTKGYFGSHLAINETLLTTTLEDGDWTCGPIDSGDIAVILASFQYLQRRLVSEGAECSAALRDITVGLLGLLRDLGYCRATQAQREQSPMSNAIAVMRAHYADPDLSVEELAQAANISPSYFRKLFRQEIKCSPQDFLTRLRLDRARYHLETSQYKVAAVAKMVGFRSSSSLHRHLRKRKQR